MKTALRVFSWITWAGGAVAGVLAAKVPALDPLTLKITQNFRLEIALCIWLAAAAAGLLLYAVAEILNRQEKNGERLKDLQEFADFILDTQYPEQNSEK